MTNQLDLPLDNDFLDPIINRRNEIVENIGVILPPSKVQQVVASFDKKLEKLCEAILQCSLLEKELRSNSLSDKLNVEFNKLLEQRNITIDTEQPKDIPVAPMQATATADDKSLLPAKIKETNNNEANKIKIQHIIQPLSAEEFESIPKYMRGRMTESDLNDIIAKFDEFLLEKRRLLRVPFNKLSIKDKDQVCKWKEQETPKTSDALFCRESDVKSLLSEKSKLHFRPAIPCLRHVKRIRELREKGQLYYLPYC